MSSLDDEEMTTSDEEIVRQGPGTGRPETEPIWTGMRPPNGISESYILAKIRLLWKNESASIKDWFEAVLPFFIVHDVLADVEMVDLSDLGVRYTYDRRPYCGEWDFMLKHLPMVIQDRLRLFAAKRWYLGLEKHGKKWLDIREYQFTVYETLFDDLSCAISEDDRTNSEYTINRQKQILYELATLRSQAAERQVEEIEWGNLVLRHTCRNSQTVFRLCGIELTAIPGVAGVLRRIQFRTEARRHDVDYLVSKLSIEELKKARRSFIPSVFGGRGLEGLRRQELDTRDIERILILGDSHVDFSRDTRHLLDTAIASSKAVDESDIFTDLHAPNKFYRTAQDGTPTLASRTQALDAGSIGIIQQMLGTAQINLKKTSKARTEIQERENEAYRLAEGLRIQANRLRALAMAQQPTRNSTKRTISSIADGLRMLALGGSASSGPASASRRGTTMESVAESLRNLNLEGRAKRQRREEDDEEDDEEDEE